MDRPVRDIPGYYYDKEKKKYFKIQSNGAVPSSSAYSAQDVQNRKTRDAIAQAKLLTLNQQRGRINRSKILERPLVGGVLEREHGRCSSINTARIFAAQLEPQGVITWPTISNGMLFDIRHRPDVGDSVAELRTVDDSQLCAYRIDVDKFTRTSAHEDLEIYMHPGATSRFVWRPVMLNGPGVSTSLSIHQESRWLASTWLAGSGLAGINLSIVAGTAVGEDLDEPRFQLGPGIGRDPHVNIYTSTPAPPSSSVLFAFGTSHGILTLNSRTFEMNWLSPNPAEVERAPKDVFTLQFLSDNPSVLLSGGRRGVLDITDLRSPIFGPHADTITHPSTITHIKQLDTHRILVAGLNSSLCQYDLRFRKLDAPLPAPPQSASARKRRKTAPRALQHPAATRAILTYPDYFNTATIQIGLDVDLETGIVAAAQEHSPDYAPVQLFSLHGGQRLASPVSDRSTWSPRDHRPLHSEPATIRCVQWAADVSGRPKSLYVGRHACLQRYSWANMGE